MKELKEIITSLLNDSLRVKTDAVQGNLDQIIEAASHIASCIVSGGKVLIFGNGGSAADAQHIAAEFVNRFVVERKPLAAMALTTDASVLTSIGNDYDFSQVFSRQITALGSKMDIAWGISTSGNSENVIAGLIAAQSLDMYRIGLTGQGGRMQAHCNLLISVNTLQTPRIQECHITIAHIICDLVDRILFPDLFQ